MPRKLATIRDKNRLQFQIAGIGNHAKTRAIIGWQLSDSKIYRTYVNVGTKLYRRGYLASALG